MAQKITKKKTTRGRRGITSIVRWNLRPVILGVEIWSAMQNPTEFHCVLLSFPELSGPLDRLNARLSLLQPLDRYRARSAIGSAIGRPLSRPISYLRTGRSPQPPRSKPLRGAQPRDSGAIVSQTPFRTSTERKRDRGRDSQPRPRPRLKSQPQGATKFPRFLEFAWFRPNSTKSPEFSGKSGEERNSHNQPLFQELVLLPFQVERLRCSDHYRFQIQPARDSTHSASNHSDFRLRSLPLLWKALRSGPASYRVNFPTPFFIACVDFAGIMSWILLWISLWIFCPSFKGREGPKKSTEKNHWF